MRVRAEHRPLLAGVAAMLALYAVCAVRYSGMHFASAATGLNILDASAVVGIVAVGMTLVIVSGGIDLSVGAVMGLSSVVVAVLIERAGWSAWWAMAAAVGVGAGLGAGMGALVHGLRLPAFIVTLAGMFMARGIGYLVHVESIAITAEDHARLQWVEVGIAGGWLRLPGMALVAVAIVGALVLHRTRLGQHARAMGGDAQAARLMGVPIGRTTVLLYAVSGTCAALAGVVLSVQLGSGSHAEGIGLELDAIAAVVVGGTLLTGGVGSVLGTVVGVMTIGLVRALPAYESGLSAGLTKVVIGALLLVFVVVQRWLGGPTRRGW